MKSRKCVQADTSTCSWSYNCLHQKLCLYVICFTKDGYDGKCNYISAVVGRWSGWMVGVQDVALHPESCGWVSLGNKTTGLPNEMSKYVVCPYPLGQHNSSDLTPISSWRHHFYVPFKTIANHCWKIHLFHVTASGLVRFSQKWNTMSVNIFQIYTHFVTLQTRVIMFLSKCICCCKLTI